MASKVTFFVFLVMGAVALGRSEHTEHTAGLTTEALARSINQFGCKMLNGLYKNTAAEENVLVSPVNAYVALAQLHLGAAGETREALSTVMKVPGSVKNSSEVHEQLHAMLSHIAPPKSDDQYGTFYETKLANGIFLQKGFPIKTTYKELVKKYYNGSAQNLDFNGEAQAATEVINKWISGSTHGRIDKFYEEPLGTDTIAVLVSALYFNAKWKDSFEVTNTKPEKFNTGVKEIEVPMMNMEKHLMYHSSDETLHYDSVSLVYSGSEHEMKIYLPHTQHGDHGSLAHLFHDLAEQNFAPNTTQTRYRRVNLKLPKMKFSWKDSVVSALNLKDIFDHPHLDALTPATNVKISNMIHATELEVDEKGTIASASTAIEMMLTSAFEPLDDSPVDFHVNRPFLVTITHRGCGSILFAGIVRKPTE